MSDVKLAVGGRNYTVSCADGQEDHVQRLAGIIDGKLASMGANLSSNEAKNLLFAALLVADELDEAKRAAEPPPEPDFDTERWPDSSNGWLRRWRMRHRPLRARPPRPR